MTRGQLAIIEKGGVMTSIEFNGDMYMPSRKWHGYGQKAINALKRANDRATYQYEVAKFNKDNHHYNDCDRLTYKLGLSALNFTKDYFDVWFSDYIYIKNITTEDVKINTEIRDKSGKVIGNKEHTLKPKAIAVLCYGEMEKIVESK